MCGIAGILHINKPVNPDLLDGMTDALTHRGPDGRGTFIDGNMGLGHRRLAILDLTDAGKCPMPYGGEDGKRYRITFNGEVFNFIELREELRTHGYQFRSDSDTEVVIAAYAKWGRECLKKFNGMFAFAIWDSRERELFLARDRFGIKPLYYFAGSSFLFASEYKAFLALDEFRSEFDTEFAPTLIKNVLSYEGLSDCTLMKGVKRLPGGHYITVRADGSANISKWWETKDHIPTVPETYEAQVEAFRELFLDAVRIRMRSDVALGTCLSGGIDSSAVASSMAWFHRSKKDQLERCPEEWQHAFIATFPGSKIDEKDFADIVVDHVGAKPHYWVFDNDEALRHIVDGVWFTEEIAGSPTVPVWCTYREMRRNNVIVSIDGHGGDELLAGYPWFLDRPMNRLNEFLYQDFHRTMLPSILRNYDRASMAHGIEVRMPIMDWRLVTFAFGLPPTSKLGGGFTKRVFRDAMNGIMPSAILGRRSKIGFNPPLIEWFNGGLLTLMERIMDHPLWMESRFWNGPDIRNKVIGRSKAGQWTYADWGLCIHIWTLMNVVLWQLLFIEKMAPSDLGMDT